MKNQAISKLVYLMLFFFSILLYNDLEVGFMITTSNYDNCVGKNNTVAISADRGRKAN